MKKRSNNFSIDNGKLLSCILFLFIFSACQKMDQSEQKTDPTSLEQSTVSEKHFSEWSAPVNMGSVINSGFDDQHPFLSKDGLSLFFSSNRTGTFGDQDIWISERLSLDSPWGIPVNLGLNINTSAIDMAPSLSPDEHWLYFHSYRSSPSGTDANLYVAHRHDRHNNLEWEPAVNLGPVLNSACDDAGPSYYENEATGQTILYFTSRRPVSGTGSCGEFDIWSSMRQPDGSFGQATYVPELSSPQRDTRTAIRRTDGLEIFISSERFGGPATPGIPPRNIWVATRGSASDPWSTPVIVENINHAATDGAPALSFDAKTLIFFSNRPGGFGGNDLYLSTRTKIRGSQQ